MKGARVGASLAALIVLVVATGCGGGASPTPTVPPELPTSTTAPTDTPEPTAPTATPTTEPATPAPPTAPPTFASTVYPYTLQMPAGVLTRNWTAATVAWDGESRIATTTPNVDVTGTVDGTLMVYGTPWTGTHAELLAAARAMTARFHGCEVVAGTMQAFDIGGIPGVGERELCALDTPAGSIAVVNGGYGMVFRLQINPTNVDVALPDLALWLSAGLTWTAP